MRESFPCAVEEKDTGDGRPIRRSERSGPTRLTWLFVETRQPLDQIASELRAGDQPSPSRSRASAMPGAGLPNSLAVTRANATSCRQRKAGRDAANSSLTVR